MKSTKGDENKTNNKTILVEYREELHCGKKIILVELYWHTMYVLNTAKAKMEKKKHTPAQ